MYSQATAGGAALQYNEGGLGGGDPHGISPRDSHEISPTIGGCTQVDDFTKGFSKGKNTKNIRRRNGGVSGGPRLPSQKTSIEPCVGAQ